MLRHPSLRGRTAVEFWKFGLVVKRSGGQVGDAGSIPVSGGFTPVGRWGERGMLYIANITRLVTCPFTSHYINFPRMTSLNKKHLSLGLNVN